MEKFTDALRHFLSYISSEKGLSLNTKLAYAQDLKAFIAFCERRSITKSVHAKEEDLVAYFSTLKKSGIASSTLHRKLISIKVFFRFIRMETSLKKDITLFLEMPQVEKKIPDLLTIQEVDLLLNAPDITSKTGSRDKAILEVLYATGIRVSELCAMDITHIDEKKIKVLGKGNKERMVPILPNAVDSIDYYLTKCRVNCDNKALFVGRLGSRLSRIDVWRRIKFYVKQIGSNKNISPHSLRHAFATHLLHGGADLRVIQEMLGHSDISTTDRYTHMNDNVMVDSFNKFHPKP